MATIVAPDAPTNADAARGLTDLAAAAMLAGSTMTFPSARSRRRSGLSGSAA